MKHPSINWTALLVAVLAAILGYTEKANCNLIAYEGFDYGPGSALNGLNGGTGFNSAWIQDAYDYTVTTGSLADPTNTLPTSGNALDMMGLQPQAMRNLTQSLGTTGTTMYVSFLLRQDMVGDFISDDHDFGGLILGGVNQPGIFGIGGLYIGRGAYGANSDSYVLGSAGDANSEVNTGVPLVLGTTALLVVRVDFLTGPDKATLFVNPVPGSPEPGSGTVSNTVDLGTFNQIAITVGNDSAWSIDEVRFGTTWQDVTPVPEPSTITLLAFGIVGVPFALRTRR